MEKFRKFFFAKNYLLESFLDILWAKSRFYSDSETFSGLNPDFIVILENVHGESPILESYHKFSGLINPDFRAISENFHGETPILESFRDIFRDNPRFYSHFGKCSWGNLYFRVISEHFQG